MDIKCGKFQYEGDADPTLCMISCRTSGNPSPGASDAMKDRGKCYDSLFEGSQAVMLLIDPASGRIMDANPSACAFYGYNLEELVARQVSDIYVMTDEELIRDIEAVRRNSVKSRLLQHRTADGDVRDVEIHGSMVQVEGNDLLFEIIHDASDKAKDYASLRQYHKRLQRMFCEILLIEEQERRQLSNLLNDNIAQLVALTKIKLGQYSNGVNGANQRVALDHIRELIEETLKEVRTLTFSICPPLLYDMGLPSAIEWLLEEIGKYQDIESDLKVSGNVQDVEEVIKVLLFRSAREVIADITQRSLSRRLDVSIEKKGVYVEISLKDKHGGIAAVQDQPDFLRVRERLTHFGGYTLIQSVNGGGSCISLVLPVKLRMKAPAGAPAA